MTSGSISNRISRYISPPNHSNLSPRPENKNSNGSEKPSYRIRIQIVLNMYRDLTLQTPMEFEMVLNKKAINYYFPLIKLNFNLEF
jgi:hypothetical protein